MLTVFIDIIERLGSYTFLLRSTRKEIAQICFMKTYFAAKLFELHLT